MLSELQISGSQVQLAKKYRKSVIQYLQQAILSCIDYPG